jgi:hypothetical protein
VHCLLATETLVARLARGGLQVSDVRDRLAVVFYLALLAIAVCCVGVGLVFIHDGVWPIGVLLLSPPGLIVLWLSRSG